MTELTIKIVRDNFDRFGISIAEWAIYNGYSTALVYQVLSGKRNPRRGQSHKIAVALGLKPGAIGGVEDLEKSLAKLKGGDS